MTTGAAFESGDRTAFLARLRRQAARTSTPPEPRWPAHPAPAPEASAPEIRFRLVDPADDGTAADLVDVFRRVATDQKAAVDVVAAADVPADLLTGLVREHAITSAVVSAEPRARALVEPLRALGVEVSTDLSPAAAARADLGVTSAVSAIAATGSAVVDCAVAGSRTASLLPRVHACVIDAASIAATPADVFRPLGDGRSLPSNLVLISGPSRTGDIEQLITLGVHGPVAVHFIVTASPSTT